MEEQLCAPRTGSGGKPMLRGMDLEEMTRLLAELEEPAFRAKQLFDWVHRKQAAELGEMHNLGRALLEKLRTRCTVGALSLEQRQISRDGTEKFLFRLGDGQLIECVLMRYRGDRSKQRDTLCVSSQAGCAMGCTFCATGQRGLARNLSAGEIVGQVYEVNRLLAAEGESMPVGNVVFMGMGEPLCNWTEVRRAIDLLHDARGQGISMRRITVSTCGVAPQIRALAGEKPEFVLAVSLHAPNDAQRSAMMPVNRRYPLAELLDACRAYQRRTGKRITFEYALMAGENDRPRHVRELRQLLRGLDCHVNVIPLNPVRGAAPFRRPEKREAEAFVQALRRAGLKAGVREEKGADIDGACGQLRGRALEEERGDAHRRRNP